MGSNGALDDGQSTVGESDVELVRGIVDRSVLFDWQLATISAMDSWRQTADSPCVIGLDTNIVLQFVSQPNSFLAFQKWLEQNQGIPIVVPFQAFQESWNNIDSISIAKMPVKNIQNAIYELRKGECSNDLLERLEAILKDLEEEEGTFTEMGVAIENLESVFSLLSNHNVMLSAFPRNCSTDLFDVRLRSKTPPGFEDIKTKHDACYGDFAVWLDFLVGLTSLRDGLGSGCVLFLTKDAKKDWMIDQKYPHPVMCVETQALVDRRLCIMRFSDFKKQFIK